MTQDSLINAPAEPVIFCGYDTTGRLAILCDQQEGSQHLLSREELEARLATLKAREAACEITKQALLNWPQ